MGCAAPWRFYDVIRMAAEKIAVFIDHLRLKPKPEFHALRLLDDGWFGARNNDKCGLGDWKANRDKLPGGIEGLSAKIEAQGMKFGLLI